MSTRYKLAEAAGYGDDDAIISAKDVEERIFSRALENKRYMEVLDRLSHDEKIEFFSAVCRSIEWMVGEGLLTEDLIDETFDETSDKQQMEEDEGKEEEE